MVANEEFFIASIWQLNQNAFFTLQVFDEINVVCLNGFVTIWGTRCFFQIKLISNSFCSLYENELCNYCNYLSQYGKGK